MGTPIWTRGAGRWLARERDLEGQQSDAARRTRVHWQATVVLPESVPLTDGLLCDPVTDRTLVARYAPPWNSGDRSWLLFEADGAMIAELTVPAGFQVWSVRDDRMFGLTRDSLDVEESRSTVSPYPASPTPMPRPPHRALRIARPRPVPRPRPTRTRPRPCPRRPCTGQSGMTGWRSATCSAGL
jgi:hypothetical protein